VLNDLDDSISALREQLSLTELLSRVDAAQLSSDQFVSLVYVVVKSAPVEWLVPELCRADQEGATAAGSGAGEGCNSERTYAELSTALCRHARVRSLSSEEETTCEDVGRKLGEKAPVACAAMATFGHLLGAVSSHGGGCARKSCRRTVQRAVRTLSRGSLLLGLEYEPGCPWSTVQSADRAASLLSVVCSANGCASLESLLNTADDGRLGLLRHILDDVLPKLTRAAWKLNPAAACAFRRCLLATGQPLMSDCLPLFLPPVLLFVDDFDAENRLSGLGCLRHVVRQSSRAELRWYGRADVVYDSLLRALSGCDRVTLDALIPCLFDVLDVVEASPRRAAGPRPWGRHDDVFARYLAGMEMESKVPVRRVYAKHLGCFVSKLGVTVVRHLSRLLRVVTDYLQVVSVFLCMSSVYTFLGRIAVLRA